MIIQHQKRLLLGGKIMFTAKHRIDCVSNRIWIRLSVLIAVIVLGQFQVASAAIDLTATGQGGGNKGLSYIPLNASGIPTSVTITARSSVDNLNPFLANASGELGTVYIDKDKGMGVQTNEFGGSKGISGGGGDKDEELIFTYNRAMALDSITLKLNDIDFGHGLDDKDDPVLFISAAGSDAFSTITEEDIFSVSAFTSTGKNSGTIDFGAFSSLLGFSEVDEFRIRETSDHIYVNGISEPAPVSTVPVPGAFLLSSLGLALVTRYRRRMGMA